MSCCGQNRRAVRGKATTTSTHHAIVYLVYRGGTRLRVRGPVSGRLYAFTAPGHRVKVDARDKQGLLTVPNLHPA